MNSPVPPLIAKLAADLSLQVHGSPFHAAERLELSQQGKDPDALLCVGYILGPYETAIYRRVDSKKDLFCHTRLSLLYGWLIKPRPRDNQYKVLWGIPSSQFTDELFVAIAREEFTREQPQ